MNEPGQLPEIPRLREITSVSPSRFAVLRSFLDGTGCALREAIDAPPALPFHPAAAMGNIVHAFLERMTKHPEIALADAWISAAKQVHDGLYKRWYNAGITPLESTVKGFDLTKGMAFCLGINMQDKIRSGISGRGGVCSEETLIACNGLLKGRIDYAHKDAHGWVICFASAETGQTPDIG